MSPTFFKLFDDMVEEFLGDQDLAGDGSDTGRVDAGHEDRAHPDGVANIGSVPRLKRDERLPHRYVVWGSEYGRTLFCRPVYPSTCIIRVEA